MNQEMVFHVLLVLMFGPDTGPLLLLPSQHQSQSQQRECSWAVYQLSCCCDICTSSSLPPADLASTGHGDQEGGVGGDCCCCILKKHSRSPDSQHFTACPLPALPAQASRLSGLNHKGDNGCVGHCHSCWYSDAAEFWSDIVSQK